MSQLPADQAITRFKNNEERIDGFVNGDGYTSSTGVNVPGLMEAVYTLMAFNSRGAWSALTPYAIKDLVFESGTWYVALVAHTSSAVFATDLASKWRVYQGVTTGDLSADSGSSIVGFHSSVGRTVEEQLDMLYFGVYNITDPQFAGGADSTGTTDSSAAFLAAAAAAAAAGGGVVFAPPTGIFKLTNNVLVRASNITIEGCKTPIVLASNTAGFSVAGSSNHVKGFKFSQSSQLLTPLALKIFNDATTILSTFNKISDCEGTSLYQGIQVYMGVTGAGAACYRATLTNCFFQNFYLQKTWVGSYGIAFDGPNAGDAGGNDSKCISCSVKGYERNYIVNNSVATQFLNCSGDGAAKCFSYQGSSTGLQIVGGYYEYNDLFMETVGAIKYDLYLNYPSYANNTAFMTGAGVSFISGGMPVGAPVATMSNGAFTSIMPTAKAEIYASNGLDVYTDNSKIKRLSVTPASGDWIFQGGGRILLSTGMSLLTDKVQGYSGGVVPLDLNAGNTVTITTATVERFRVDNAGNVLALGPYNSTTASASNMFVASDGTFQRSTSSAKYKTNVETLYPNLAEAVFKMRPVWYRSTCEGDRKEWSWYGLIAEEVAAVDPRLVHWGYSQYKRVETLAEVAKRDAVKDSEGKIIQPAVAAQPARFSIVPDKSSPLVPEGVQYDRLTVLLIDVVKRQNATLLALEARLKALEEK